MAKTLEERIAGYVARLQPGFTNIHHYFAEGFEGKYRSLIEAALSEGRISERYATFLRRTLAGETESEIAKASGISGQDVTRSAIWIFHNRALARLKSYVAQHKTEFDELYLGEIENVVRGNGNRPPTAYETAFYNAYETQRLRAEAAEELNAKLKATLEEAVRTGNRAGKEVPVEGARSRPYTTLLTPIDEFGVPTKYLNSLKRAGLAYVEDLQEFTKEELRKTRNVPCYGTSAITICLGDAGIALVETALGYLGYWFKGSEPKPFPMGEDFRQSPTALIFDAVTSRPLAAGEINNFGQLAYASDDRLHELLGAKTYEDAKRIMHYYRAALQEARTK